MFLEETKMERVSMFRTNASGAMLNRASLKDADLREVWLNYAHLKDADLYSLQFKQSSESR